MATTENKIKYLTINLQSKTNHITFTHSIYTAILIYEKKNSRTANQIFFIHFFVVFLFLSKLPRGRLPVVSRLVGKPTMWFPYRFDTNRPVQAQKHARSFVKVRFSPDEAHMIFLTQQSKQNGHRDIFMTKSSQK